MTTDISQETTNQQLANKMLVWAIVLFVLGLLVTTGLTQFFLDMGVTAPRLYAVLDMIGRLLQFFGMPFSAGLVVGSIIMRRIPPAGA